MKTKERLIDLSDIKDDELDKTASFTDLMSRSERKKREKEKKKKIDESNNNIEDENNFETNNDDNIDKKLEINNISEVESTEKILEETKQYEDLTKTIDKDIDIKDNVFKKEIAYNHDDDDDEFDEEKSFGSGLIITMGLFLLISTGIFIYSIIFTNNLDKNKFLIIDSIILTSMYFLFGLSIITNKKFGKFLSIINYLAFISFIAFNVLLTLNYIK